MAAAPPNHSLTYQLALTGTASQGVSLGVSGLPSKWTYVFSPREPRQGRPACFDRNTGHWNAAWSISVHCIGELRSSKRPADRNSPHYSGRCAIETTDAYRCGWRERRIHRHDFRSFGKGILGFFGGGTFTSSSAVGNTSDDALYQSLRGGSFSYRWALPNGAYTVTLKFADMIATQPGTRMFSVAANGNTVLNGIDIVKLAGANNALDESFQVNVTNGQLSLEFSSLLGIPIVNAIQVR